MTCKCGSERIMSIGGKASDLQHANFSNGEGVDLEHHGYAVNIPFLGGGDYFDVSVCMDCGHVQGFEQLSDEEITELFEEA